jgi:hypothetical protein
MSAKNVTGPAVYQIKVTLVGSKPPIWRRVLVASDTTLAGLHDVIQAVFGWWDSHLHEFIVGETHYGQPHPEYDFWVTMYDEADFRLADIVPGEDFKFRYVYDFGDDWRHQVLVEKILPPDPEQDLPRCIKGRRACPPEDVGGIWGYENMLEVLADPTDEEYNVFVEWIGDEFDPKAFDLQAANEALAALRNGRAMPVEGLEWAGDEEISLTLVNRGVALLKPKQPLVDWVNGIIAEDDPPLTLEGLRSDCTALLIPDFESQEQALEFVEVLKPLFFLMELESWSLDLDDWPRDRTVEVFDAWFDVEVHSMVWDLLFPGEE